MSTLLRLATAGSVDNGKSTLIGRLLHDAKAILGDFRAFRSHLAVRDVAYIPISALNGDNVVDRSEQMPWYGGAPLLEHLEAIDPVDDRNLEDLRFPVQLVVRSEGNDYRGYAG